MQAIVSFAPLDALATWLQQFEQAPALRLVATSSMSVLTKRTSEDVAERALVARLKAGEESVIAQCQRLGIAWTLLRPTLIYGAGMDKSLTPIARRAMRIGIFPIPMAQGLRQPVHADDIALAVMQALQTPAASKQILQIGGGERLPYQIMFERVRRSLSQWTLPLWLPHVLLCWLPVLLPRARGPVSRLQQDLIADNGPLLRLLGVQPRPFHPQPLMWQASTDSVSSQLPQ